jgi:hypothetical protein
MLLDTCHTTGIVTSTNVTTYLSASDGVTIKGDTAVSTFHYLVQQILRNKPVPQTRLVGMNLDRQFGRYLKLHHPNILLKNRVYRVRQQNFVEQLRRVGYKGIYTKTAIRVYGQAAIDDALQQKLAWTTPDGTILFPITFFD